MGQSFTLWIWVLLASLSISAVALVGYFALIINPQKLQKSLQFLISLSVGVFLGDAFLHLIPDAAERTGDLEKVLLVVLGGILLFFVAEKIVRSYGSRHSHGIKPIAQMNLIGDAIHNFIDGTLIAGSFLVSPVIGVTTTIAIIIHEIPQEIGDTGSLIYGGYSPRKAIWYNFLCSLTCTLGAALTLVLGTWLDLPVVYLMPIAAGGFIYIAACDLIPELHNSIRTKHQIGQGIIILCGIGFMFFITIVEGWLE